MAENAYNELAAQTAQRQNEAQKALTQRMTDMGLASAPLTLQSQAQMAAQSNLGQISRQQKAQDEFNQAMQRQSGLELQAQEQGQTAKRSYLDTQTAATLESIRGFGAQALAQQQGLSGISLSQQESMQGLNLAITKDKYALDDANREREMYYKMFLKRKLSAKQFKDKTGIEVKAFSSGRRKPSGLFGAAAQNANLGMQERNVRGQQAQAEADKAIAGPVTTSNLNRIERADAAVKANPVRKSLSYRNVLDDVISNQNDYITKYGTTEYKRVVDYLNFRSEAEENQIDLSYFAPNYEKYQNLIENQDEAIAEFGQAGYNLIVNTVGASFKAEMKQVYDAIELKNSGTFSNEALAISPSLAQKYPYSKDPEDQARQRLGLIPLALEKDAKKIIEMGNPTTAKNTAIGTEMSFDSLGGSTPTEADFLNAVKTIDWENYRKTWGEAQQTNFDKLTPEQQQAWKDQYYQINKIEYQVSNLADEQVAEVAVQLGLGEDATRQDIASYFRMQMEQENNYVKSLGLDNTASAEDIAVAEQDRMKKAAVNLGLAETASQDEIKAEYDKYQADPIKWTNEFYDKKKTEVDAKAYDIESQRAQALSGLRASGASDEDIQRLNDYYNGQSASVRQGMDAERKSAIAFIEKSQKIDSYDKYLSSTDFGAVSERGNTKIMDMARWNPANADVAFMSDKHKSIYAYLLETDKKEAQAYKDLLQEEMNSEWGQRVGGLLKDIPVIEQAFGVIAGIEGFGTGIAQLFTDKPLSTSANQYAFQTLRQDAIDNNDLLGRLSLDFAYSFGNMAPTIGLSMLTGGVAAGFATTSKGLKIAQLIGSGVGSASLGASAGGQAYGDALRMGYTQEQAKTYGALIGMSEGGLQFALGGISKLGGVATAGKISKLVTGINNSYLKFAAQMGLKGLSEGAEEYLQEIINPILRNAVLGEDNEIRLYSSEAVEAALMGAMMAWAFDGRQTWRDNVSIPRAVQNATDIDLAVQSLTKTPDVLRMGAEMLPDGTTKQILLNAATQIETENAAQAPVSPEDAQTTQTVETPTTATETPVRARGAVEDASAQRLKSWAVISEKRLNAKEMNDAVKQITSESNVEIDNKLTLTETIDALEEYRELLTTSKDALKSLKPLRINTNGLTKQDLVNLGRALQNRDTAAKNIGKLIDGINKREEVAVKKAQDTFKSEVIALQKKATGEVKTLIDNIASDFDLKSKELSNKQKQKLETKKANALAQYGSEANFPAYIKQRIARLGKEQISGMTATELESKIDEVRNLAAQFKYETSEEYTKIKEKLNADIERIAKVLPSKRKGLNRLVEYIGSPQRILGMFGPEVREIIARPVFMANNAMTINQRTVNAIKNKLSKDIITEFSNKRGIEMKGEIYDGDLGLTMPRVALLGVYMNARDTAGFQRIVENGFRIASTNKTQDVVKVDGASLQNFIANFEERYKDLAAVSNVIREVFDHYTDKLNDVYRRVYKKEAITEQMKRDNPYWYHEEIEPNETTIDDVQKKDGMPAAPGFLKERNDKLGGELNIVNPLWIMESYHNQSNLFTSYAIPVREAAARLNSEPMKAFMREIGNTETGRSRLNNYAYTWLMDVANGRLERADFDKWYLKILSSYNKAQLAFNPSVIITQPSAYPLAAMFIESKYLLNKSNFTEAFEALTDPRKREALFDECPMIYDRFVQGHSIIEAATDVPTYLDRVFDLRGIRYSDAMTTAAMWYAAKRQAADGGTSADEAFHNVLWTTQAMFETPFRSNLQKSVTGRIVAPFTSQTFQQHNMLFQSMQYKQAANDARARGEVELAEKYDKIGNRGFAGAASSVALFAAMKFVVKWALAGSGRDDEEEKDIANLWRTLVSSGLETALPVVGNLAPAYINKVLEGTDSKFRLEDFGLSTPIQRMYDVLNQTPNILTSDKYTLYGKFSELTTRFAEFWGVPAENIEKYVTEALEELIPDFEYDYLKKKPTIAQLTSDYIYSGGEIPKELPSSRTIVYDNYWEIIKDGTLKKDEEEIAKRLYNISSRITDQSEGTSITALYKAMRDRAVKEVYDTDQSDAIMQYLSKNKISVTLSNVNSAASQLGYDGRIAMTDSELEKLIRRFYQ